MYELNLSRSDFRNAEMRHDIWDDYLLDALGVPEEERDKITGVQLSIIDFETIET
ncbi:hypothetical protein LCGC14_0906870 [marine sediment metagenome]|uniref:Uncharacterized protein n=1 Tax=marine sediment metagenome TaxID=412755 RepID=A0A0F9PFH4_9ZZZZ